MKKVVNVKEIMIILISIIVITMFTTSVFASNPLVLGDGETTITQDQYEGAFTPEVEEKENTTTGGDNSTSDNSIGKGNNATGNNATGNNTKGNNTKVYSTNNNTDLPQTGIEDYNIGILLIICTASAVYAYKRINDYRSI